MPTISVATFSELETALASCLGPTIAANTTVELTADITVTDTLRIGRGTQGLTVQSSAGNMFALSPASGFRNEMLTIGNTWCSSSGPITNMLFKDLKFTDVSEINGGITLGPVFIGSLDSPSDDITFDNVHWKDNTSPEIGSLSPAGLRIDTGTVTITNSRFENNQASGIAGGALFTGGSSTVTVSNTVFTNNGESLSLGGAAAYIKGDASFDSCTFSGNSVNSKGGAITLDASDSKTATFTDCTFTGNSATSGGDDFYVKKDGHTITFSPCTSVPSCKADMGTCPCGVPGGDPVLDLDDPNLDAAAQAAVAGVVALGTGIIVGIAVGGAVTLGLLILACYCCCCRQKKTQVGAQVVVVQQSAQAESKDAAPAAVTTTA